LAATTSGAMRLAVSLCGLCWLTASCHRRVVPVVQPVTPPAIQPAGAIQLDQSNAPRWEGGWSIIGRGSPAVRFAQTFTPLLSTLAAVEIDIMTGNEGRGGDTITVRIVDGDRALATVSKAVAEGFDGVLRFDFGAPGIRVTPGATLQMQVEDTNRDVFGWRYGRNTYAGGVAYFNAAPWNDGAFDFRFSTYGY
jgi:hypothetical protein